MKRCTNVVVWMIAFGPLFLGTAWAGIEQKGEASNNKASSTTPANRATTSTIRDMSSFVPGTAAAAQSRVLLTISARNLTGRDYLSKSDPMCVVYIYPEEILEWTEYMRTETIEDVHNPDFVEKIEMDFFFEVRQPIYFEIYDIDSLSQNLKDHDFLGYAKITLGKIVHERKVELQLNERKQELYAMTEHELTMSNETGKIDKKKPYIIIRAEKLKSVNKFNEDRIIMELSGSSIARINWWGFRKSNPYVDIYKAVDSEASDYVLVHRTETIYNTGMPRWKRFPKLFTTLSDADRERKLKFVCKNSHSRKEHRIIGQFETTIAKIEDENMKTFELIQLEKKNTLFYKNSGFLHIEYFDFWKTYPFIDYVMGGLNVHCTIAIDFTGSNGDPRRDDSLHYINPSNISFLNHYQQAITAVVSIIEDYDTDKKFPVLGFGAVLPNSSDFGEASQRFFVNLDQGDDPYNDPFCIGVDGVLHAYRKCILQIQLSGPTHFKPIIQYVVEEFAERHEDGDNYFILLILTDGQIMDMDDTKRIIIKGSRLPLSIIIVGIGKQNFKSMDELDADGIPLRTMDGLEAERDIVQFVPFNQFFTRRDDPAAKTRLAKEVLAEVPRQLVTYMASRHFVPRPPQVEATDLPPDPERLLKAN